MTSTPCQLDLAQLDIDSPGFVITPSLYVHDERDLHVSKSIRETGCWETYETRLVLQALPEDGVLIDVGANIGYYSVLAGLKARQGHVYSFEPEPRNFALLQKNIRLNQLKNVSVHAAALSNKPGEGEIFLNPDNWGDHQIYASQTRRECCKIQLLTGDSVLASLPTFNVLKVDTQGAEFQVLCGLKQLIKRSLLDSGSDVSMVIEFWPKGLMRSGACADQLLDQLLGYELPMAIVDQQQQGLIPCQEYHLRDWIKEVDQDPENEGFLNLFLSQKLEQFL